MGFTLNKQGLTIMHLQFADNTLFFCEPNRRKLLGFKVVLRCFELIFGLKRGRKGAAVEGKKMERREGEEQGEAFERGRTVPGVGRNWFSSVAEAERRRRLVK